MSTITDTNLFDLLSGLTQNPWILSLLVILATFILEDAATSAASLLSVNNFLPVQMAISALIIGIVIGDIALYMTGYFGKNSQRIQKFLEKKQLKSTGVFLHKNTIATIISARFIPGLRLPTYVAMGLFEVSFQKFIITVLLAVTSWTAILFILIYTAGTFTDDLSGNYKIVAILSIFICVIGLPHAFSYIKTIITAKHKT